jgi:hypothetical protein
MSLTEKVVAPFTLDKEKIRYRNQFVLGPAYVDRLAAWKKYEVAGSLCLTAHPDLNVEQVEHNGQAIVLMGFILDPNRPAAGNGDILKTIADRMADGAQPHESTRDYGGRWILIVVNGDRSILFNDAAGLRQVFYTNEMCSDGFWCASQPGMLAELLDLEMSEEALDFIDSYEFRKYHEFRFPGDSSPYRVVQHMLPNHLLDLGTRACHRYWPDRPLATLAPETAAEHLGAMLRGLLQSASSRFDLALSLTAGLDSRIVMAASRELIHKLRIMTVRQLDKPDDYMDVAVPAQLLSRFNLAHEVVRSSLVMDREFLGVFYGNTALPHPVYAPDAYAIMRQGGHSRVAVTGSASEIGRTSFKQQIRKPENEKITAEDLAGLQKMGGNRLVIQSYDRWLSSLGNLHNVHPLDLFEWEQGHGNWLAMCQLEFDVAWQDIFTPYNCRKLLETMLAVSDRYRESPDYSLHKMLVSNLWPELLEVPINPRPHQKKSFADTIKAHIPHSVKQQVKQFVQLFEK